MFSIKTSVSNIFNSMIKKNEFYVSDNTDVGAFEIALIKNLFKIRTLNDSQIELVKVYFKELFHNKLHYS
jgi:hypothetical protein